MRLLTSLTFKLKEFVGEVPDYAILRHTLGPPDEEVNYQDIQCLEKVKKKSRFVKIKGCCAHTRENGTQWC
jgi:hypothetical protein